MSDSNYIKIFSGNSILVKRLMLELEAANIVPIVKDEGESQRLAGYGSLNQGYQDIVVRQEEVDKAKAIIDKVQEEL